MANRYSISLPVPYVGVKCRVDYSTAMHWPTIVLYYCGTSDDLIASGVAQPHMFAAAKVRKSGVDEHGNRYVRRGRLSERISVMLSVGTLSALARLPGVDIERLPEPLRWLRANPGKLHIRRDGQREIITGAPLDFVKASIVDQAQDLKRLPFASPGKDSKHLICMEGRLVFDGYYMLIRPIPNPRRDRDELYSALKSLLNTVGAQVAGLLDEETYAAAQCHLENVRAILERAHDREHRRTANPLRLVVNNLVT